MTLCSLVMMTIPFYIQQKRFLWLKGKKYKFIFIKHLFSYEKLMQIHFMELKILSAVDYVT